MPSSGPALSSRDAARSRSARSPSPPLDHFLDQRGIFLRELRIRVAVDLFSICTERIGLEQPPKRRCDLLRVAGRGGEPGSGIGDYPRRLGLIAQDEDRPPGREVFEKLAGPNAPSCRTLGA